MHKITEGLAEAHVLQLAYRRACPRPLCVERASTRGEGKHSAKGQSEGAVHAYESANAALNTAPRMLNAEVRE